MRAVSNAWLALCLLSAVGWGIAGCGDSDDDAAEKDAGPEAGVTFVDETGDGNKPGKGNDGKTTGRDGGSALRDGAVDPNDNQNHDDDEDGGGGSSVTVSDAGTIAVDAGPARPVFTYTYEGDGPPADKLPTAKGACPTFAGDGDYLFNVQGGRQVLIGVDASKASASGDGGPVIFYWHGTNSNPGEAIFGIGEDAINDVKNQGGLVAGFYSTMNFPDKGECDECKSSTGNNVWFLEDFNLADEVLACAIEQLHIDTRRIHASGMSAGGLQTTAMMYARSNYLASVAPYSGGEISARTPQDPSNKVAAMIFHGTYDQDVVGLHFYATSKTMFNDVVKRGAFAIDCNHGLGHTIPVEGGYAVWRFFQTHPYEITPSPWATMLPADLPPYCSLTFQVEDGAGGPFG